MTSINEEQDFIVEIKENVVYNQLQLVSFLDEAIATGLMTRAEAIKTQRDLNTIEEAEEVLKLIEEDQKKQAEITAETMNQFNPEGEPGQEQGQPPKGNGMGKLGKGKDPDVKGKEE